MENKPNKENISKKDIKILKNSHKNKKQTVQNEEKIEEKPKNSIPKTPINIEDLKNYAEKIKNINFSNVKLKKRKKRYGKNHENHEKIFENHEIKQISNENPNLLTEELEKHKNKASFNEVSSILRENQENSYENFEEILKNIDPESSISTKIKENPLKNTHTDRVFSRKDEKNLIEAACNEKKELSVEKYSIQTLDVAREKVRNFKLHLNALLGTIGNGSITEHTKEEISALIQEFANNKYIISTNDRQLLLKLQEILEEKEPNLEKKRSFSANIFNKAQLSFNNNQISLINNKNEKNQAMKSEVIEENNDDSSIEGIGVVSSNDFSSKGFKKPLKSKVNQGHFSKLNRNYAENVGKALENSSIGKNLRNKSKEKLYSDIQ